MVTFVPADYVDAAVQRLASRGLTAWPLGQIRNRREGEIGDSPAKGGGGGAVTLVGSH